MSPLFFAIILRNYQYGADGNLIEVADSRFGTVFYDYDPLSRLQKTRGVVEESFAHDPAGNLLDQVIGAEAGKKPFDVEGNQLKFHGDSHYEYDEFGRLITEKRGKDQRLVTNYDYDCQHRLVKASLPDGSFAHYKYDAFGRRIEKKVTDKLGTEKTTEFVWQGDTLIAETSSEHYQTYVYDPGTFKPMAMLSGEGADCGVYHYHLDQIGTPTDITDLHGKSVWSVQYRAYGNVLRKHVEEISSPLRFQGQYFDEETGLHYNRHRYYSPSTGRFVTADPIGLAGGLNNYQYVPNPTGWIDPLGLVNKKTVCPEEKKRINVGEAGHHAPSVRKSKGRSFEIKRSDKNWPTFHFLGDDTGHDHWRLHEAERQHIGPRQGDFLGSDQELIDAYKKSYKEIDGVKIDVRSPNNSVILAKNVTPYEGIVKIELYLKEKGHL
ncbi:RHS domain-containing protein [Enterovibrio sp. ZSDZ42]|uniref:RHS domain-containing protein n=1 Tax=Enterovibrio gelatinilyticus TaxID=2899819 RepID=A0ABT5R7U6_9GAMM|nr:RHS repeat-associated core domain-containing protein [Enterovibrio sp. ZSDZ42]MDD1796275.1 RHS domain-containing protein [Enterovibrio sp. ZSDZ42]